MDINTPPFNLASIDRESSVTIVGSRRKGKTTLAVQVAKTKHVVAVVCGSEGDRGIWKGVVSHGAPVVCDYDADLICWARRRAGDCVVMDEVEVNRTSRNQIAGSIVTLRHVCDMSSCGRYVFGFREPTDRQIRLLWWRSGADKWIGYDEFEQAYDQATSNPFTALVIDTLEHMLYHYSQ